MSELGTDLTDDLGEWVTMEPITLSHWQVRMVLQGLAACYDQYHLERPSDHLPAVRAMVRDEVVDLIQATINDIALQTGIIDSVPMDIAVPTRSPR